MRRIVLIVLVCLSVVSTHDIVNGLKYFLGLGKKSNLSVPRPFREPERDVDKVSLDNINFAIHLYKTMDNIEGNLVFSPDSLSAAMGMAFAGSRGETQDQIKWGMYFKTPNIHGLFKVLIDRWLTKSRGMKIMIANSLWVDQRVPVRKEYVDFVVNNHRGDVQMVDFARNSTAARDTINDWIAVKTKGKIKNILDEDPSSKAKLMLVNAVFFTGEWATQFDPIGKKTIHSVEWYDHPGAVHVSSAAISALWRVKLRVYHSPVPILESTYDDYFTGSKPVQCGQTEPELLDPN